MGSDLGASFLKPEDICPRQDQSATSFPLVSVPWGSPFPPRPQHLVREPGSRGCLRASVWHAHGRVLGASGTAPSSVASKGQRARPQLGSSRTAYWSSVGWQPGGPRDRGAQGVSVSSELVTPRPPASCRARKFLTMKGPGSSSRVGSDRKANGGDMEEPQPPIPPPPHPQSQGAAFES